MDPPIHTLKRRSIGEAVSVRTFSIRFGAKKKENETGKTLGCCRISKSQEASVVGACVTIGVLLNNQESQRHQWSGHVCCVALDDLVLF